MNNTYDVVFLAEDMYFNGDYRGCINLVNEALGQFDGALTPDYSAHHAEELLNQLQTKGVH